MTSSLTEVPSWPPLRYSAPLSEDFTSDGFWLIELVHKTWKNDDGTPMVLDDWQRSLIIHVLETYPPGHAKAGSLRYRECFVSVARQNGKSVIGGILALYGLLREAGALVIGIASNADQANIIYKRVKAVIDSSPALAQRFERTTVTRGLQTKKGSLYQVKASKSNAVQGLATSVGIVDELHITEPALWSDMVNGIAAKPKGLVFGITTAGDESSELLIELYKRAEKDDNERFGFFIWEAEDNSIPEDDETLARYIMQANPSVAEGRRPVEDEIPAVRSMPQADALHYRLNRFIASLNPYMRSDLWRNAERKDGYTWPEYGPLVFSIDQTPEDGYATITAVRKDADGHFHTELVAWLVNPNTEQLVRLCEHLWMHNPAKYVMDGWKLRPLGKELQARGYPVYIGSGTDTNNASSFLVQKVTMAEVTHAGDPLLNNQMARAVRKQKGDAYRIMREGSDIDAVMATALGVYVAEQQQDMPVQVF